jgi:hypothetical protein
MSTNLKRMWIKGHSSYCKNGKKIVRLDKGTMVSEKSYFRNMNTEISA